MLQGLIYKLMLTLQDMTEICSKTQFIQFTDWQSGWKWPSNNLQATWKKRKKCCRVGNELCIKDNIKAHKY